MFSKQLALASLALLWAAPCSAGTLYVSGTALSTNTTCAITAPCDTLQKAHDAASTQGGDTVVCLTPPVPTGLSITRSITIDCSNVRAVVRDSGLVLSGGVSVALSITINTGGQDQLRTVRLRGLTIDAARSAPSGGLTLERAVDIGAAVAVYLEDCVISNAGQRGISDRRAGGQTKLFVSDCVISGNGGAGIVALSAATGITVLENVRLQNNGYGIATGTGNNVVISRSVISGNSIAGVEADGGAQVEVTNSVISHNNVNVQAFGTIRLRENDIKFSNIAVQGATVSMGANRFSGNGSIGTAPTLATGAPADITN